MKKLSGQAFWKEIRTMAIFPCIPILAAMGLSLSGCSAPSEPVSTIPAFYRQLDSQDATIDAGAARDMISIYRRNNGLPALVIDPALQKLAAEKARAMAAAGESGADFHAISQKVSTSSGKTASQGRGENISAGYHTLAEAFSGWRQSKPHNATMLNPTARRMGIATAYAPGSKYHVFWALVMTD